MNKLFKFFSIVLLLIGYCGVSIAQFNINGEFRPRTEYLHGYNTLAGTDQNHALFTEQRTRLNLNYTGDKIKTSLSLQDIRVWGSTAQSNKTDGYVSVHEAWAEVAFTEKLYLKAGRQELVYDDSRLFGNGGWTQQGRSHDAFVFKWECAIRAHFGFAYNQDKVQSKSAYYSTKGNYKAMQFLWIEKGFDKFTIGFLGINNGIQRDTLFSKNSTEKIRYTQTIGPRVKYTNNKLTTTLTAYYQMGDTEKEFDKKAYYGNLDIAFKASDALNLGTGIEMLSGTTQDNPPTNENNSFDPLYGSHHKFNGHMDYFYVGGQHFNGVGLLNPYLKIGYKTGKINLGIDFHYFMAAQDVLDANNETMEKALGSEIDFYATYTLNKVVNIQTGYSQMFATETMQKLRGGDKSEMQNWAWIMLTVKPNFFTSKE